MSSLFRRLFSRSEQSRRPARAARRPSARPEVERLETRLNPSLVGGELHVNPSTSLNQADPDVATNRTGTTVVVWVHQFSSTDKDIYARMYDSTGTPTTGTIFVATSGLNETAPAVAIDSTGFWIVVWTLKESGGDKRVEGRWFNSSGVARTSIFTVEDSSLNEYDPDVALDTNGIGNAAVSYTKDFTSPDKDVRVELFADGATTSFFSSVVGYGNGDGVENKSSVAMDDDGNFSVAYQDAALGSPSNTNIRLSRFNSAGTLLQDAQIAAASFAESNPSIAMDDFGDTIVAWQQQNATSGGGWNIRAKRVTGGGSIGSTVQIASTSATETLPAVAMSHFSGSYVVAYQSKSGSTTSVKLNERSLGNTDLGTINLGSSRFKPSIGIDDSGADYFVAYEKTGDATDPGKGIFARRGFID
jgi:hypothetical protein